jgi:hypothetical protein
VYSVLVWLVVGLPLLILLGFLLGWWIVLLIIPLAWATWDFIQRGGGDPTRHWWGG